MTKRLWVHGLESEYHRDLQLIGQLFFDEIEYVDHPNEADWNLFFTIEHQEYISIFLRVVDIETGKEWSGDHVRNLNGYQPRKRIKQAINFVWLNFLEEHTGIRQPWGILTGVRPTKLFHMLLLEGKSIEEAEKILLDEYKLLPEKTEILKEIVRRQKAVLPDLYELDRELSIYIGIPFCPTKCAYCTFPAYAIQGRAGLVEAFLEGLQEEIKKIGEWIQKNGLTVTTIYFGGGTPTAISAPQMDELFHTLKQFIPSWDKVRELTVEAGRPDTLDVEKLNVLKSWDVDRISINPQSFKEETLKLIGRHHTVKETIEKYQLARQMGFNNINMDVIIGLPGEELTTFQSTLDQMEVLKPESLTVHTLSFKRGSIMTQNKEKYRVASSDETKKMVQYAREWAKKMGYVPYYLYRQKNILGNQENVGYALPGQESLYNIIIMEEQQTIIGLGCGAVSKIISPHTGKLDRLPNPKEPQAYVQSYHRYIEEKLKRLDEAYKIR